MRRILRRLEGDMRNMRHIEAYTVTGVGFVISLVSLLGGAVGSEVRWSTLFAGLGVVVYRAALPRGQHEDTICGCVSTPGTDPPADVKTVVLHIDAAVRVVVVRPTPHLTEMTRRST